MLKVQSIAADVLYSNYGLGQKIALFKCHKTAIDCAITGFEITVNVCDIASMAQMSSRPSNK